MGMTKPDIYLADGDYTGSTVRDPEYKIKTGATILVKGSAGPEYYKVDGGGTGRAFSGRALRGGPDFEIEERNLR